MGRSRGTGVARGRGAGLDLGDGVGRGVLVGIGVGVAVAVAVAVALGVTVGVGVGVVADCSSNEPLSMRPFTTRLKPGTALIEERRRSKVRIPSIDSRTARQQLMCESRTAIVL